MALKSESITCAAMAAMPHFCRYRLPVASRCPMSRAVCINTWPTKTKQLPEGYQLEALVDMTYYLNGRLNMMWSNLLQGSVLVFLMLMLFLRVKVAFWVMLGLRLPFLGAIWLMPFAGVTINIVTLFAFIMVLGIVVDDAIVIGESAYHETSKTPPRAQCR